MSDNSSALTKQAKRRANPLQGKEFSGRAAHFVAGEGHSDHKAVNPNPTREAEQGHLTTTTVGSVILYYSTLRFFTSVHAHSLSATLSHTQLLSR